MKVLQISTHAGTGPGGVMGGYRIYKGMISRSVNCKMLVGKVLSNNPDFAEIKHNTLPEKILSRLTMPLGLRYIHYISTFGVPRHPFFEEADIVNYHSIHSSYFNYLALPKLTAKKPGVYTLHDMWSFTGHCITSYECERWKIGCGKCPYPKEYPEIARDNTRIEWKLKKWAYKNSNLHIVTPSRWLKKEVAESILAHLPSYHIPNGIDTSVFNERDRRESRKFFKIPDDRIVLLFAAFDLSKSIKGGDLVVETLKGLPSGLKRKICLVLMGNNGIAISGKVDIECVDIGFIADDELKAIAFSSADLFIYPTRADNLPYIVQESLGCGTPVLSFDVGGVSDLVVEGETGYLTQKGNIEEFREKLVECLENESILTMRKKCISHIGSEYTIEMQIERYLNLYKEILKIK